LIFIEAVDPAAGRRSITLLFGAGLIGRAIVKALRLRVDAQPLTLPCDWNDPRSRRDDIAHIEERVGSSADVVNVIWSAGKGGFFATSAETALELETYKEVVALASRLRQRTHAPVVFHLISSAGGLYEGQRHITADSTPAPVRPYGFLKLHQEAWLRDRLDLSGIRIYRVSSAYGYVEPGTRTGLVGALITDGLRRSVTHLNATMRTLRDFVFVDDIGAYIADQLTRRDATALEMNFLVRARPCSILEVQHMIEDVMGRQLLVAYTADAANSADITFSEELQPSGWHPSDLRSNIGIIYRAALSNDAAAAAIHD